MVKSLKRSLSIFESLSFSVSGQVSWIVTIPYVHTLFGLSAMLLWVPLTIISMMINLQVANLSEKWPNITGGTPNLVSKLWEENPFIARYAAYGYYWAWMSAIVVYGYYFAEVVQYHFQTIGISLPLYGILVMYIVVGFLIAFASQRLLPIIHTIFVYPVFIILASLCFLGGFYMVTHGDWTQQIPAIDSMSFRDWSQWFLILIYTTFAGEVVSVFVSESIKPKQTIKLLRWVSLTLPLIFIIGSWYFGAYGPKGEFTSNYKILGQALEPIFGSNSGLMSTLLIIFMTSLSGISAICILPRVLFQLAKDGLANPKLAYISKRGTLDISLWVSFFLTFFWLTITNMNDLTVVGAVGYALMFVFLHLGIFKKRKNHANSFPYISVVVGVINLIIIIIGGFLYNPWYFLAGLLLPALHVIPDKLSDLFDFIGTYTQRIPQILKRFQPDYTGSQVIFILIIIGIGLVYDNILLNTFIDGKSVKVMINDNPETFFLSLFGYAAFSVLIAGWITIPQLSEISEAKDQVVEANELLKDDIQKRKSAEKALIYNVNHDTLTGLGSRSSLYNKLRARIRKFHNDGDQCTIYFLDLNKFKWINDTLGHTVGDHVLRTVAHRLETTALLDEIFRFGGDEFVIIQKNIQQQDTLHDIAHSIGSALERKIMFENHEIFTSMSMGISQIRPHHHTPDDILKECDIAMYFAKHNNLAYAIFDTEMEDSFRKNHEIYTNLQYGLEQGEIQAYYQPVLDVTSNRLIGFEALARWYHKDQGFIPPSRFISIAEETHLIDKLSKAIIDQVFKQLQLWQHVRKDISININISSKQLNFKLHEYLLVMCKTHRVSPQNINIELTESMLIDDRIEIENLLQAMKKSGFNLYLDDFGTGYSNLSYLQNLPVQALKIDKSFILNPTNHHIAQAIQSIASNLSMQTVAEGVETESDLEFVRSIGCNYAQGYLYAKPLPADEATAYLKNHTS
jgi:diguanylate cyclase (GGDEF)-like protein